MYFTILSVMVSSLSVSFYLVMFLIILSSLLFLLHFLPILASFLLSFLPALLASGKQYIQSLLGDSFTEEDIVEALRACNLNTEVALNALLTQRSSRPHSTKETTTQGKSRSFAPLIPPSSKG